MADVTPAPALEPTPRPARRPFRQRHWLLYVLGVTGGVLLLALAFAVPYGWGNGVMTIVRGTVPEALFGGQGYGSLLGRLARPQFVARASAPVVVALVLSLEHGRAAAPWLLAAGGFFALFAYRRAIAPARV